jgi:eukaryotic-like serine/threonine-protein kinase
MPDVRVIAGKYRLVAKLSEGGMGSVWSAEHMELNCPAAVKLLDPSFADSPEALSRFKREAQSAASLRSTNIVQILDFGIDDGVPYIAMELLRGQTLAARLADKGHLAPRETAIVLSQVARAVAWAHDMGIIHRDLKPGNIFLSDDAGQTVVKLLDFGIAKPVTNSSHEASMTSTGVIMGTPQYMSPEQASGSRSVDHRTDIWSFGVVAYECIIGKRAFAADTLGGLTLAICSDPLPVPSRIGQVPKGFDEWFARCSHRDPGRRFLSIDEASDILSFVCGLEVHGAVSVPQLYSESPLPVAAAGSSHARSGTGTSTDAPSILTLSSSVARRRRVPKLALFVGLFVTGALLALLFRSGHDSAVRATAVAPASAMVSPGPPALSQPISESRPSSPSGPHDAPLSLDFQQQRAVPIEVAQGASMQVARNSRVSNARPGAATTRKASTNVAETAPTPSSSASAAAPDHAEETPSASPPAASARSKTVEDAIGLKRTSVVTGSR